MRASQYLLSTLKNISSSAKIISHQLMLRAGMIRKLSSGLYTWLPTGMRVLKNIENIIRDEMNRIGAIEVLMPIIQPIKLWKQSGRLKEYGLDLLNFIDRNKRSFIISPTHEEAITAFLRKEISSFKQLPLNLFQIQSKFRDEIRPRFGVIRAKEFLMKDAYSFHDSQKSLQKTYYDMYVSYKKIFSRIGLNFHIVRANNGSIGGKLSHEFHILTKNGEDKIVFSNNSNYSANIDLVEALLPIEPRSAAIENIRSVDVPNIQNILELTKSFNLSVKKIVKTFLVKASKKNGHQFIALLVRGDHELNEFKASKLPQILNPLTFASVAEIREVINANPNYLGPVNMPIPLIIDRSVAVMSDFVAGANIDGKFYFGINWDRDIPTPEIADIRNVMDGDPSPSDNGSLIIKRSIEVGHIFQLGNKYSQAMNFTIQSKNKQNKTLVMMGCYGIGITRVVAAVIEQNHDEHGIIWPESIAPFKIAILPINIENSYRVREISENLYKKLCVQGIEVIIDDRKVHPGIMFADIDLIGIPHVLIIGDRNLQHGNVEYKCRRSNKKQLIKVKDVFNLLIKIVKR